MDATPPVLVDGLTLWATEPAFWLRVDGPDGARDVDLDVLDAAALLLSHRLPLQFAPDTVTDWDAALRTLVDGAD